MGLYVRWQCPLVGNTVAREYHRGCDEITLLFRYMEEERVWLLMRRLNYRLGIELDEGLVGDLIKTLNSVAHEHALGIHWNSGRFRTELERSAEELIRFDRVEGHVSCPIIRDLEV